MIGFLIDHINNFDYHKKANIKFKRGVGSALKYKIKLHNIILETLAENGMFNFSEMFSKSGNWQKASPQAHAVKF